MNKITSVNNDKVKNWTKLLVKKNRDKQSLFIVEGDNLVKEAKLNNLVVEIISMNDSINPDYHVTDNVMAKITSTKTPPTTIAICKKPENNKLGNKVLVLHNLQDPGNVGTLIRTARAFEFDSVIIVGLDVYNPKVIRSTQGAFFSINLITTEFNFQEAKKEYQLIGTSLSDNSIDYRDVKLNEKYMLFLGNEGKGLDQDIQNICDANAYIPIKFESLNVATAGAIIMNHFSNN